jgi:hypothetical protein
VNDSSQNFVSDVSAIDSIEAVPTILQVICSATQMGFAAVARVTEGRWVACSVVDRLEVGLRPGVELPVENTIDKEIRRSREGMIVDLWPKRDPVRFVQRSSFMASKVIFPCRSFFEMVHSLAPSARAIENQGA